MDLFAFAKRKGSKMHSVLNTKHAARFPVCDCDPTLSLITPIYDFVPKTASLCKKCEKILKRHKTLRIELSVTLTGGGGAGGCDTNVAETVQVERLADEEK